MTGCWFDIVFLFQQHSQPLAGKKKKTSFLLPFTITSGRNNSLWSCCSKTS